MHPLKFPSIKPEQEVQKRINLKLKLNCVSNRLTLSGRIKDFDVRQRPDVLRSKRMLPVILQSAQSEKIRVKFLKAFRCRAWYK